MFLLPTPAGRKSSLFVMPNARAQSFNISKEPQTELRCYADTLHFQAAKFQFSKGKTPHRGDIEVVFEPKDSVLEGLGELADEQKFLAAIPFLKREVNVEHIRLNM